MFLLFTPSKLTISALFRLYAPFINCNTIFISLKNEFYTHAQRAYPTCEFQNLKFEIRSSKSTLTNLEIN